ncbi:MAG: TetR family transcriptional regulator [Pseudonocardia sp.]|nr:TetR family transcriptional regulator [Pseudonocardia sp.]
MAGLRERKKAGARVGIQRQALLLFGSAGYQATTVEQVAEAAQVSPRTVFRYFPTKESLLVLDDHLSLATAVLRGFEDQPSEVGAAEALRAAIRAARDGLPNDERAARRERDVLLVGVPELWSANTALIRRALDLLGAATARRSGREPGDPAVRAFTGAVLGIAVQAFLDASPGHDPDQALDDGLRQLARGLGL